VVILQSVDAFTALVRLGIDVAREGVHARVMGHQSTIPSTGRELFAIPDGRHLCARGAHHACGAATAAVGSFHGSFLLILLLASEPEPDSSTDNDAENAEDAYGDTDSSTCREAAAGRAYLAVASLVGIVCAGRQSNGDLTGGAIRRHGRHYGQWRGGSIGGCTGGRSRFYRLYRAAARGLWPLGRGCRGNWFWRGRWYWYQRCGIRCRRRWSHCCLRATIISTTGIVATLDAFGLGT